MNGTLPRDDVTRINVFERRSERESYIVKTRNSLTLLVPITTHATNNVDVIIYYIVDFEN